MCPTAYTQEDQKLTKPVIWLARTFLSASLSEPCPDARKQQQHSRAPEKAWQWPGVAAVVAAAAPVQVVVAVLVLAGTAAGEVAGPEFDVNMLNTTNKLERSGISAPRDQALLRCRRDHHRLAHLLEKAML